MTYRLRFGVGIMLVIAVGFGLVMGQPNRAPPVSTDEVAAVQAALWAWGEFASSGDLEAVSGLFANDGPQFRQLVVEAPTIAVDEGAPYRFVLADAVLLEPGVVRGVVTVSRLGQPDQQYFWDVELRLVDGRWQVWTVRTANPGL